MKIAIFHLGFFYVGGGERLVLEEAVGLQERGHQVMVFAPVVDKDCFPELQKKVKVRPILPQLPKWIYDRETLLIFISCLVFPFLAFRFRRFDIFLGANQPGPWFCWWLKKMFHKPYLIYLAQPTRILYPRKVDQEVGLRVNTKRSILIYFFWLLKPLVSWVDKVSITQADEMLVNGWYAHNNLRRVYKRRGIVCPAGCHPIKVGKGLFDKRFSGSVLVNGFKIKKPFVLLTNRHFPQKKFEYALEMLQLMGGKKTRLVVTGQRNSYTNYLEKLAKKMGLSNNQVFFLGLVSEKDLGRLYKEAACYVYTAPDEDFGMGVVEAMGYGVPVVAWQSGGPADIVVDQKTGYLIPLGQIKQFAQAVRTLLKDRAWNEKMGLEANRRAFNKFSYKDHNSILEQALLKTVSR